MALGLTTPWHFISISHFWKWNFKWNCTKTICLWFVSAMLLQSSCFDFQECSGFPWWVGSRLVVWILKKSPCKRDCYLGLALGSQTTGPQTPKPKPFVDLLLVLRLFQWEIHGSLWFQQAKCCQDSPSIQCQIDRCIYIYISLRIQSASQMMIGVYNHLLSKVFRFHYHSQKVIGSLGYRYTGL